MVTGTYLIIVGIIFFAIGYVIKEFSPKNKRRKLWHKIEKEKEEIAILVTKLDRCMELIKSEEEYKNTYYRPSNYGETKKCHSKLPKLKQKLKEKEQELKWDKDEYDSLGINQQDSHHSIIEYLPLIVQIIALIAAIIGLVQKFNL